MNRRVDYGRIALVLVCIIILIFAADFCVRLYRNSQGGTGSFELSEPTKVTSSADGTGTSVSTENDAVVTTTTTTVPGTQYVPMLASEIHNGPLVLVNGEYPMVGTPECKAFSEFEYAHFRLPSRSLQVNSLTTQPLVTMFNDFFAATGLENVMIYATTNTPSAPAYALDAPERATGLTLDLGVLDAATSSHAPLKAEGGYAWLPEHCHEYGYIQRYPEGKEDITGQAATPWHLRYVGLPHAAYMAEHDLCLEEYLDVVDDYSFEGEHLAITVGEKSYEVYYVPKNTEDSFTQIPFSSEVEAQVSGDNRNGFIVTCVLK